MTGGASSSRAPTFTVWTEQADVNLEALLGLWNELDDPRSEDLPRIRKQFLETYKIDKRTAARSRLKLQELIREQHNFLRSYLGKPNLSSNAFILRNMLWNKVSKEMDRLQPSYLMDDYPRNVDGLLSEMVSRDKDFGPAFKLLQDINLLALTSDLEFPKDDLDEPIIFGLQPETRLKTWIAEHTGYIQNLNSAIREARNLIKHGLDAPASDTGISASNERRLGFMLEQARGLADELSKWGKELFDTLLATLKKNTEAEPTEAVRNLAQAIAHASNSLRRATFPLGGLIQPQLPAGFPPKGSDLTMEDITNHFKIGEASGAGNNCWFNTVAQLKMGESKRIEAESWAELVRKTSNLLGLSTPDTMYDYEHGTMDILTHFFGLNVQPFRKSKGVVTFDTFNIAGPSNPSAGRQDNVVYILCDYDNGHFVPLWPKSPKN
jgi:hypothetical protein